MHTRNEIIKITKEENVKYLKLQFTDMLGTIKSVEVPISKLEKALDGEVMFDGSSIEGFVRIMEADMYLEPDLSTFLILPLESNEYGKVARFICNVKKPNGEYFEGDPRYNLQRICKRMEKLGYKKFNVGVEPEFYLFKLDENNNPTLNFNDNGSYFDMAPLDSSERCRHDIVLELEKLGFIVEASHHEVGPGQNEINFKYDDVIATCDKVQTFKQVVKQVAKRYNLHASFMPKPLAYKAGSGMHVNCSLEDVNGNNVFYDEKEYKKLSVVCHKWISGILSFAKEMSAITNPIVNSYKRLVPGYEAPCYICWSDANRSSMIRIPAVRGEATRTEIRNVDPYANPYLAFAAILAAGLKGIEDDFAIIPPVYDNIFEYTKEKREEMGIANMPENLKDATLLLKGSSFMEEILGTHIFKKYVLAKEMEWEEYRVLINEWEIKRYL